MFCGNVRRTPSGSLWLGSAGDSHTGNGFVRNLNLNIASFDTAGIDVTANYGMDLGDGERVRRLGEQARTSTCSSRRTANLQATVF